MITALVAIASVIAYVAIAGFIQGRSNLALRGRCKACNAKDTYRSCYSDHGAAAFFTGALWPLALPFLLSALAGARDKTARLNARRQIELDQARHDSAVAAERRREAEHLSRELRALGVES